ncbi:MAG: hypothetical protein AAGD25_00255 [Cyanobacteria bacterium P01_F01_bin.150]
MVSNIYMQNCGTGDRSFPLQMAIRPDTYKWLAIAPIPKVFCSWQLFQEQDSGMYS